MGRLLGIDFGLSRIGMAITDERRIIVQPFTTIKASKEIKQTIQLIIDALKIYKNIDTIVIGLPLLLDGKEGDMARAVRIFGEHLNQAINLPIVYWDERLTSSQVDKWLKEAQLNRKKRAELSDVMQATTILQNYLDSLSL